MDRSYTKQIYLLSIIVLGIISLSIYSTYAIFTYEAETSNILSINTPGSLRLSEKVSKYKQITVPKNAYTTTDIDIYNNFDYDLCYSIWYKTDDTGIKIYEKNENLTSSGLIETHDSRRVTLIIINDSEKDVNIKFGLSYSKNAETCELNIEADKKQITSTLNDSKALTSIIEEVKEKESESGYLEYKDNTTELEYPLDKKLMVATNFEYKDEVFTLKEPITIDFKEETNNLNETYYTCLDKETCRVLYKINELKTNEETYTITKYDMYFSYMAGASGVRKVNDNYYFYGDNPDNYLYYNCKSELSTETCELWRIIGLTYDAKEKKYQIKITSDEYLGKMKYSNDSEEWSNSEIQKYLNEEYKLNDTAYLKEITFKQENAIDLESKTVTYYDKEIKDKYNLLNLSDYLNTSICTDKKISEYTGECLTNNWLNKYSSEWTMTMHYLEPVKDPETNELIPVVNNKIYTIGSSIETKEITTELNIRPVVYLKDRMLVIAGDGSYSNPYVIR